MENSPDYIVQSDGPIHDKLAREIWFKTIAEAYKSCFNVVYAQFSVHPEKHYLLFEGWRIRPSDMGKPRWQPFTSIPAPISDDVDPHWPKRRDAEGG
jgi:hypothetical protein